MASDSTPSISSPAFLPHWHQLQLSPAAAQLAASCFIHSPLLLSGVVSLHQADPDELFAVAFPGVGLYEGEIKSPFQSGTIALTSHRVLYFHAREQTMMVHCLWLEQVDVSSISATKGFGSWSHPKVVLAVSSPHVAKASSHSAFKFSFRQGGCESFHSSLAQCLQRKLWCKATTSASQQIAQEPSGRRAGQPVDDVVPQSSPSSTSTAVDLLSFTDRAGIGGVQRTQTIGASNNDELVNNALSDVDSVLSNASVLIQEIKKIRQQVDVETKSEAGSAVGLRDEDFRKLLSLEEALGLHAHEYSSASSRTGGMTATQQLAQEILAWLSHPANAAVLSTRYLIPITELYALYNSKARGRSQLISPQKFYDALKEFGKGSLPQDLRTNYSLRTFRCGIVVLLCTSDFSTLLEKFLGPCPKSWNDLLARGNYSPSSTLPLAAHSLVVSIDATSLAQHLQVHISVASELLEDMELEEILCRDESTHSVTDVCPRVCRFCWNLFLLPTGG